MSTHGTDQPLHSRDGMFERAVRRAGTYRRADAPAAPAGTDSPAVSAGRNRKSPASDARILRRWSVAELIVSASLLRGLA